MAGDKGAIWSMGYRPLVWGIKKPPRAERKRDTSALRADSALFCHIEAAHVVFALESDVQQITWSGLGRIRRT